MNELIIQFAVLWGLYIGSAMGRKEIELAEEMKEYESDELLDIFSAWAKEFLEKDYVADTDLNEFFEEKLCELMHE